MEIYEKAVGSILLVFGLAVIGYSLYLGVNIFIKAQDPPQIFKPMEISKPSDSAAGRTSGSLEDIAKTMPKNLGEINPNDIASLITGSISPDAVKSMIPPEIFGYAPRLMNLSVFSIFLWVLILAGGKVSSLGIALIKTNSDIKF